MEPTVFDIGQVADQTEQRQFRRGHAAPGQLLGRQAVTLPGQRLPLIVEETEQRLLLAGLVRRFVRSSHDRPSVARAAASASRIACR